MGFTTIELLIVIAVIAVLLALLMMGIAKTLNRRQQAQTQQDIIELVQGLENFKTKFTKYPPSSLNQGNYKRVFQQLFGSQVDPDAALTSLGIAPSNLDLQGDQCLVLFLGGRHSMAGGVVSEAPSGFSENPINPFEAGGNRIGPFFKFDRNRLYQRDPNCVAASYADGWFKGTYQGVEQNPCYAYFSTSFVTANANSNGVGYYSDNDCSRMVDGAGGFPRPFVNLNATTRTPGKFEYVNKNSFQIISSGPDTLFGNAFKYPAKGNSVAVPPILSDIGDNPATADNYTNFSEERLGQS
jgi:type II secretory pathway pseudopilin PulG